MAGINSWLKPVTGKLKELASDIVTVRTGTVISDFAAMTSTIVVLDNDPDGAQVQALALSGPLPTQTRVMMVAYPPRGLAIVGTMAAVPPMISGATMFTFYGNDTLTAAQAAPFRSLLFRVGAGGGAGGGAPATTLNNSSGGGGGGGGGYAERMLPTSGLIFPLAVTVGGGGTGVSGGTGNNGGTSSVIDNNGAGTTLCSASGGSGGGTLANGNALGAAAAGGAGGSYLVSALGGIGTPGFRSVRFTITAVLLGAGGSSPVGGGGGAETGNQGNGSSGSYPSGGGAGAHQRDTAGAALAGADGSGGIVSIIGIP